MNAKRGSGNGNNADKYRELAEHETALMDDFAGRLGSLETTSASTDSRLNSLVDSVEKIGHQIEKMADRTRPNLFALITAVLSSFALIATYGVLAFAPVYRTIDLLTSDLRITENTVEGIVSTRFTPDDARNLELDHDSDVAKTKTELSNRIYRNEGLILDTMQRIAKLEGKEE